MKLFNKYVENEQGSGLVEYTLIIALIALAAVAAVTTVGTKISTIMGSITTAL